MPKKQMKESLKILKQVAKMIPYSSIVKGSAMIEVEAGFFSQTFKLTGSGFNLDGDNCDKVVDDFASVLNAFGGNVSLQFTFDPTNADEKYLTLSVHDDTPEGAHQQFVAAHKAFGDACRSKRIPLALEPISITETLDLMYRIYNHGAEARMVDKVGSKSVSAEVMQEYRLSTKDLVGPKSIHFGRDYVKTETGFIRVMFVNSFANHISPGFMSTLLKMQKEALTTVHYQPVDPADALARIEKEITDYKEATKRKKKAHGSPGKKQGALSKVKKQKEEEANYPNYEEVYVKEGYTALLKDAIANGEYVFQASFLYAFFAPTLDALNEMTENLTGDSNSFFCRIVPLDYQQKAGLASILPLANNKLSVARTFSAKSAALFLPFCIDNESQLSPVALNKVTSSQVFYSVRNKIEKPKIGDQFKVKKTIQETLPYRAAYLTDGIFEMVPGVFSRMYAFSDINYHTATEEDQTNFLIKYSQLLNRFDASVRCQIVLNNKNVDMRKFEDDNLLALQGDKFDVFRKEYNALVTSKMEEGRNNLRKERYMAITVEAENFDAARHTFNRLDPEIVNAFKEIGGAHAEALTTLERLEVLYDIYNIGHEGTFMAERPVDGGDVVKATDLEMLYRSGVTSKDLIAPSGFNFKRDWFMMGSKFCRVLYLVDLPNTLSDKFVSELSSTNCNLVISINLETVRQDKAVKMVKHQMLNINSNMQQAQQTASKNGYSMELVPQDLKQAQEEANELLRNLTGRNQKMFLMTFTVLVFGDDYDEMQTNTEILVSTGRKYLCNLKKLNYQQEDGLNATLPYCFNRLTIKRTLTTDSTIIFSPFDTQELIQSQGMYYGQNATSHNLIIFNRGSSQNGNGWILGTPGCVDAETEFFNGKEWKSIADYKEGDLVLQYDPETDEATLVEPLDYIKAPCDRMYHFETPRGVNQTLSPEHRVLYYKRDNHHGGVYPGVREISAEEMAQLQLAGKFRGRFKTSFFYDGPGIDLTDLEIKLMLAVICDGYFDKRHPSSTLCTFNLKKARKKNELFSLIREYTTEKFRVYHTDDGYTHYSVHVPRAEKTFSADWYRCNHHQLQLICDNILQWDGHVDSRGRKKFVTVEKATADFVQYAFSACGYRAVISYSERAGQTHMTNGKAYIRKSNEYTIFISNNAYVGMEWRKDGKGSNAKLEVVSPPDGYKYCFTVPTHALVLRRAGRIFISGNSGKSFSAKREMANVFLNTDDDILVIDPEREYSPLVKAFGGSIVRIAPGSKYHLNPLDMDKDYGDDDDPIVLKSDFMLSLCESVIGGRYGLTPTQIAIIDRVVGLVYRDFIERGYKGDVPTLLDFEDVLEAQPEREAKELALAFEIYTRGSLDVFAHRSNVDINNRFVVYDIKDIGSNIKTMSYLIVLDAVWNRVISNRRKGKRTWIYMDEVYILFEREESTNFIRQIFSRGRKWGARTTAITQNVEPILQNTIATTMLSNSAFIELLNQAPVDRDILAALLHISPTQVSFINNAPPGQGVLYVQGQGIIPFRDNFSKQLAPTLYGVMTSKPDELSEEFR